MAERIYCSEANAVEPMCGTADVVDVWLMLEYRPVWKAKALVQSDLTDEIQEWVAASMAALAERGLRVRPQLVRQPELDRDEVRVLVAGNGRLLQLSGVGYDFLLSMDLAALAQGALPPGAEALAAPRYFVCTNGQRDLCCARFGLPVYDQLRERVGDRVWQVSHLGGHRFAPNVLVLPQGVLYGRVHPGSLDDFVASVESGEVAFAHLRGRTCYPQHVQAAEALAGRQGLRLLHVDGDEQAATVTFAGAAGKTQISVARYDEPLEVLTSCGDETLERVFPYRER